MPGSSRPATRSSRPTTRSRARQGLYSSFADMRPAAAPVRAAGGVRSICSTSWSSRPDWAGVPLRPWPQCRPDTRRFTSRPPGQRVDHGRSTDRRPPLRRRHPDAVRRAGHRGRRGALPAVGARGAERRTACCTKARAGAATAAAAAGWLVRTGDPRGAAGQPLPLSHRRRPGSRRSRPRASTRKACTGRAR